MLHSIPPEYQKLIDSAKKSSKQNKTFLDRLKKQKPKDLDHVTNEYHMQAFENIDCLQCANCCATTGPLLKNRDINSLAGDFKLRPSEFAEKFLRTDEDGDWIFKKMPCPFLKSDNYCSVYSSRPNACRDFPHTQQRNIAEKLPVTYLNSMICPAVAVVIEKLKIHYSK